MSGARQWLRSLIPARGRAWWRRHFGWRWFHGDYAAWADAQRDSRGYDDAALLAQVCGAARAVRAGRAAWDRDGTVFAEPAVHAPLVAELQAVAREDGDPFEVVDFGGALGSTWWQHRRALGGRIARWRVVEQAAWVEAGRREFGDATLSFHASLAEATQPRQAAVILLSSVLPYLESPHTWLAEIVARRFRHVIVDRTPFVSGGRDRLTVQRTPPALGGGSYPCWLFARAPFLRAFAPHYDLVAEWPVDFDQVDGSADYRGFHFVLRSPGVAETVAPVP